MNKSTFTFKRALSIVLIMFGLTFVAAAFVAADSEDLDISAVVPGASTSGGGGSGSQANLSVSLSGYSFPFAKLTVLKDGVIMTTLIANPDGTFQITVNNLVFGNYQFSIYAEDPRGTLSSPQAVNASLTSQRAYVYSGIVIPPTLSLDSSTVEVGHEFTARGYVAPGSNITLDIPNSQSLGIVTAGADGAYVITSRANLPPAAYELRSRATVNNLTSLYSRPASLLVFAPGQTPPPPPTQLSACVDYNKDRRVNLIDFSILLFWFGKQPVPDNFDCNHDHVIDMKDFSILMYYWTG
jgi:hypothetical protein